MAIPRFVVQIWMQGLKEVPEKYLANIHSIIKQAPDWKWVLYDENNIREAVRSIGNDYLAKFDSLRLLHQRIDFGRYAILYKFGGMSVDIDAMALKSFNEIPHLNDSDFIVSKNSTNDFINNATILVSKENPLMKQLLDEIDGDCKFYQGDTACVMYSTGPMAFTKFVNKNLDKIVVLDNKFFESCSGMDKNCTVSKEAILDHRHEGSWVNPLYNDVRKVVYNFKPYRMIIFVILVLVVLWLILRNK